MANCSSASGTIIFKNKDLTDLARFIYYFNKLNGYAYYGTYIDELYDLDYNQTYEFFITDGDNFDKSETTSVVKNLSNYPIFLQFVGVGNAGFDYLEKLDDMGGRYVDNADFFKVTYNDFYIENNLYGQLLQEYPNWLSDDRVKDMIQNNFKREPKNEPKKKRIFRFI